MTEKDLISQLKKLKAVEPDKDWLMAARSEVLSKTSVFGVAKTGFSISAVRATDDKITGFLNSRDADLSRFSSSPLNSPRFSDYSEHATGHASTGSGFRFLFSLKWLKPAMASLMAIMIVFSGSILTVKASQESLPGEPLYGIKRMLEGTQITIASDKDKPVLEAKFVGRRLEEMIRVSEKTSDIEQEEKIKKLAQEVEEGMKKTENHLAALNGSLKDVAKAAKTVNIQTEKYADVLVKTNEKLPEPVKKKVEEAINKAAGSTEKVNFKTLGTLADIVESEDEVTAREAGISKEEVKGLIQNKIESKILDLKSEDDKDVDKDIEQAEVEETEPVEPTERVESAEPVEDATTEEINAESSDQEPENNEENADGDSEDSKETKTEVKAKAETEKVKVDCAECGEENEKECLEETDEEGNTECYIEQLVTVSSVEDKLDEARGNLEEGNLTAAVEILTEAGGVKDDAEVKGADDGEVLDDDEVISE